MQQKVNILYCVYFYTKKSNLYMVITHKAKLLHILEFDIIFAFKLNF